MKAKTNYMLAGLVVLGAVVILMIVKNPFGLGKAGFRNPSGGRGKAGFRNPSGGRGKAGFTNPKSGRKETFVGARKSTKVGMPEGFQAGSNVMLPQQAMQSTQSTQSTQPMQLTMPQMPSPIQVPNIRPTVANMGSNALPSVTAPMASIVGSNVLSMSNTNTNSSNGFQNMNDAQGASYRKDMKEGFRTNYSDIAGGARDSYEPIGAFDGVTLPTGNNVSSWRYTAPDEALIGAPFEVGTDSLFMFKNNQCKPECCGSSFSCSGGCVCTTPDQRQYIAGRGGNRSRPQED